MSALSTYSPLGIAVLNERSDALRVVLALHQQREHLREVTRGVLDGHVPLSVVRFLAHLENVSTQKVESALLDHPNVGELAVVGLPHERWGEAVTAFVVPTGGENAGADGDVDAEAIDAYARDRLAGFERPKAIELVEELPKTATGKIRKQQFARDRQEYWES